MAANNDKELTMMPRTIHTQDAHVISWLSSSESRGYFIGRESLEWEKEAVPVEVDTETTAAGATAPEARITMRELIEGEHGTELHTDCTCDPRNRCDACLLVIDPWCDCCYTEPSVAVVRFGGLGGGIPIVVCAAHKAAEDEERAARAAFEALPDDVFAAGGAK